jgi:hypothetical protein
MAGRFAGITRARHEQGLRWCGGSPRYEFRTHRGTIERPT